MSMLLSITAPLLGLGQCYEVNSFDLGFINIIPTLLLVEIKQIDWETNSLELSVLPVSVTEINDSVIRIARWFSEVYPGLDKDKSLFKNAAAFQRFVARQLALPYFSPPLSPAPPTLLSGIQRRIPWPILTDEQHYLL